MGLFNFIGEIIQQSVTDIQEAQMISEDWDVESICRELQRTSSLSKSAGYSNTLRSKCRKMSNKKLMSAFDYVCNQKNSKACKAMMPVMQDRGLAYEDDNGRIVRTYNNR